MDSHSIEKEIKELEDQKEYVELWEKSGFFGDAINEWAELFENPQEALLWKKAGFEEPEKIRKYKNNEINDPIIAIDIEENLEEDKNYDIKEIKNIIDLGVSIESAVKLFDIGMNEAKVKAWKDYKSEEGKNLFDVSDDEVVNKIIEWKNRGKVYKTAGRWENLFFDNINELKEKDELELYDNFKEEGIKEIEEAEEWIELYKEYKEKTKEKFKDIYEFFNLCKEKDINKEDIKEYIKQKEEVEKFSLKESRIKNMSEKFKLFFEDNNKEKNEEEKEDNKEEEIEKEEESVEEEKERIEEKKEEEEEFTEEEEQEIDKEVEEIANNIEEDIKSEYDGVPKKQLEDIPIIINLNKETYKNNVETLKKQLLMSFPYSSIRICGSIDNFDVSSKAQFFVTVGENTAVFKVDIGYVEFEDRMFLLNAKGKIDLIYALNAALQIEKQKQNIIANM